MHRRGYRREIEFIDIEDEEDLAPAALIESPLYREGQQLQPWQQNFLTECLRHQRLYGTVRLLLADEVGLGKTLSLAIAALTLCLLADKPTGQGSGPRRPVVIFAPATLTEQWQTEMLDKLGIPTARWDTVGKSGWMRTSAFVTSGPGADRSLPATDWHRLHRPDDARFAGETASAGHAFGVVILGRSAQG